MILWFSDPCYLLCRVKRKGLPPHASAPLPLALSLLSEEKVRKHCPYLPAFQRTGSAGRARLLSEAECPVAPGCGKVSAWAGGAFGFVFPPHHLAAAIGVVLWEHIKAWRLLSTEFCLLPVLYKHISSKRQREGLFICKVSIFSATILELCLLQAIVSEEGDLVCWIELCCMGLQLGLLRVGL